MSPAFVAIVALILCLVMRILNITSQPQKPILYCKDADFLAAVLKLAPILDNLYIPTRLWGFSGHVQTIVHSVIGRVKCPWPIGERTELVLGDGSTLTYDVYQPIAKIEDDVTLVIVPGICNTSESVYVRTFVHYAQYHGYRCAVLNHVGALSSVPLTASRVFTYGYTGDLHEMVTHICQRYPASRLVCIGYSMGGNLVTKYIGEVDRPKPNNVVGAVSVCQGYSAIDGTKWMLQWQNFRRVYLYAMTEAMKSIVLRHRQVLLSEYARAKYGLVEKEIISAATLPELDDAYTRKVYNFKCVEDLYNWSSCINYLDGIKIPMVFINALDDPLVPHSLLNPIREFSRSHDWILYMELAHGGHLGFYEGGIVYPNPIAWLDRTLVALVGPLAQVTRQPRWQRRNRGATTAS
ncbi:hypothetical protein AAG570_011840 [Ranatra chinensis]|uniref:AB hydrolase-1 domain-containing protein n=1 Tax=Ranatra chinensis TaxID=642074 RepID=A0ABD0YJ20_9HEMI